MKKCSDCGKEKTKDSFYKCRSNKDGRHGRCIVCSNVVGTERYHRLKKNKAWLEKERERGRLKYYRLGYAKKRCSSQKEGNLNAVKKYNLKYPEKNRARKMSQNIKVGKGYQKHHWSYTTNDAKDVIFLTTKDHNLLHVYIIYDQERMMYRDTGGILLDTKKTHIELLAKIKEQRGL